MIRPVVVRFFRVAVLVASVGSMTSGQARAEPLLDPVIRSVQVGFHGVYKLGCWTPITVELEGQQLAYTGHVAVTVPDSDGVPTTVVSPRSVGVERGQTTTARLFVRIGQANSPIKIQFTADGKQVSERTFFAGSSPGPGMVAGGMSAAEKIVLQFGPPLDLTELVRAHDSQESGIRVLGVETADELPTAWFGYEGVDAILLTTSAPELYRPLLQSPSRLEALRAWVNRGGRLAVFCGAHGEELLSPGGALEKLIPGTYSETLALRRSDALESYCGVDQPVTRNRRLQLAVSRLENISGKILLDAGGRDSSLPLAVRARLGLGELIFVGLDWDRSPLSDWSARDVFFKKVLVSLESRTQRGFETARAGEYPNDLVTLLRDALDTKFVGVEVISFGVVTGLIAAYILLIGPGDYFFVKRILRRPALTWLTFPLIVLGTSALAYWFGNWMKGDQLRVNQVEVVDIDTTTGQVRGTAWTHVFTPRVHQYDLTFEPEILGRPAADSEKLLAWLGKPGYSLGGMQAGAEQTTVFNTGYTYAPELDSLRDVSVQVWSTKTITARWSATSDIDLQSKLVRDSEQLTGQFTNTSAFALEDCHLLYDRYAYYLGPIPGGAVARINESKLPRRAKTLLTNATAGDARQIQTADDGAVPFSRAKTDVARLVKVMMFYDIIDGRRYTGLLDRYQSFIDLSYLLEQDDLAILLCRVSAKGSQWLDDEQLLQSSSDRRWTYYRFVLPVGED